MIPNGKVEIPDWFWKVVISELDERVLVLALNNLQNVAQNADPYDWIMTIDGEERLSGFDALGELKDGVERVRSEKW